MPNASSLLSFTPPMHNSYHITKNRTDGGGRRTHQHECFELFYVISGSLIHKGDSARVELAAGDVLVVPPGHGHSTFISEGVEYYTLSFKEDLFHPGFVATPSYRFLNAQRRHTLPGEAGDIRLKITVPPEERGGIEALLCQLLAEYAGNWSRDYTTAGSLVTAILLILARTCFGDRPAHTAEQQSRSKSAVQQCIRHIDDHYTEELSIDDLCRAFALSRSVFVSTFTEETGMPVKRYINQKRIERAKALCAVEALSIKEIAALVGYQDFSTFYRNFKKYAGVSPLEFRGG